jgi:hypothetical protein
MSTTTMTLTDLLNSTTGFDEVAVTNRFGIDLYVGNDAHPMKVARAAVFVHLRREGMNDADAYNQAMNMGVGDIDGYFAPEPLTEDDHLRLAALENQDHLEAQEQAELHGLRQRADHYAAQARDAGVVEAGNGDWPHVRVPIV